MKKSLVLYSGVNFGSYGVNLSSSRINNSTYCSSSRINGGSYCRINGSSSFFNFSFRRTAGGEESAHSQDNQNFFHSLRFLIGLNGITLINTERQRR